MYAFGSEHPEHVELSPLGTPQSSAQEVYSHEPSSTFAGSPTEVTIKLLMVSQPSPQHPFVASSIKPIRSPAEAVNVTVPDCGFSPTGFISEVAVPLM